jgi:hypothetical protein
MDTSRIDICYRPLRIAWVLQSGDRDAFRQAVRLSHTMFGGRFNPIVLTDRPEARDLVHLYRADLIVPLGDSGAVREFAAQFPHLRSPLLPEDLFLVDPREPARAHILDIHNALVHWRQTGAWNAIAELEFRSFRWDEADPLADVFLMQLGAYPRKEEIGIDYLDILSEAAKPRFVIDLQIHMDRPIPIETLDHPSLAYLAKHRLHRHYSIRPGWDYPGLYLGDAADIDDLVRFWNLRAADIQVQFIDPGQLARFDVVRPAFEANLKERLSHLDDHHRKLAVWATRDRLDEALKLFPEGGISLCGLDHISWKGGAIVPPAMILGEASSLGVSGDSGGQPYVSFALNEKPFSGDVWFHTQHLVASLSVGRTLWGNPQHTYRPPFVPELNGYFSRTMYVDSRRVRIERERIGVLIDAADNDMSLRAIPMLGLAEQIFDLIGVRASLSGAGLITRQLIARLGGIDGARIFKIPGVRRLMKTHGPNASFTMRSALQLIGGKVPGRPDATFDDHRDLYIEPRPYGTALTPGMAFGYMVEKGLFRIGAELDCPGCRLASWVALDQLRQRNTCELCGVEFDATRQLVGGEFRYRRSGVLGLEKNTQGAVPVALVLQQLAVNVATVIRDAIYLPSLELKPKDGVVLPGCETDFLAIYPEHGRKDVELLLGECKDEGGKIDAQDVENVRQIADALATKRFDVFILFAKLSPFSDDEIALVKTLNGQYHQRVILLTERELEPYHLYERTEKELGIKARGGSLGELARVTAEIYFKGAT